MSAHVSLNLLNELGKEIRCEAVPTSLIHLIIVEHESKIIFTI